jgi:transposase
MVRWQDIHDLPIAGKGLVLDMQTPQFDCEHCGKTFTTHSVCILERTHVTERLAEALTDCVNISTLSAASAMYHIPESTVRTIFEKLVERRQAAKAPTLKPMTKLGVDEIHLEMQEGRKKPGKLSGSEPMTQPPPNAESGEKIRRE